MKAEDVAATLELALVASGLAAPPSPGIRTENSNYFPAQNFGRRT
jgi:hypothetical protein